MRTAKLAATLAVLISSGLALAQVPEPPTPPAEDLRPGGYVRGDYSTFQTLTPEPIGPPRPADTTPGAVATGDYGAAPPPAAEPAPGPGGKMGKILGYYNCPFDPDFTFSQGPWAPGTSMWLYAEYLLVWLRTGNMPELIGTIPAGLANTNPLPAGAINPIFIAPGSNLSYGVQNGLKATAGLWLNPEGTFGLEGSYLILQRDVKHKQFASSGSPVLGQLYFDPVTGRQTILESARPGPGARTAQVGADVGEQLWGFESNLRFDATLFSDRTDFLVGLRYFQFSEGLNVHTASSGVAGDPLSGGTQIATLDQFGAINQFYGLQFGCISDRCWGNWFLTLTGKLALGGMHQVANISGATQLAGFNQGNGTFPGGVLTQPTNIGHFTRDRFVVVPEFALTVGRQLTSNLRAYVSYDVFCFSNVIRPGDMIAPVDGRQIRSSVLFDPVNATANPKFDFNGHNLWVQGFTFGFEFRY